MNGQIDNHPQPGAGIAIRRSRSALSTISLHITAVHTHTYTYRNKMHASIITNSDIQIINSRISTSMMDVHAYVQTYINTYIRSYSTYIYCSPYMHKYKLLVLHAFRNGQEHSFIKKLTIRILCIHTYIHTYIHTSYMYAELGDLAEDTDQSTIAETHLHSFIPILTENLYSNYIHTTYIQT